MAHDSAAGHGHGHYITPVRKLTTTLGVLAALTLLTVITGKADWIPGFLHVPLAMVIAAIKVGFVVLIFMGLKHDNRVNGLAFVVSLFFVLVFLTFTLFDTAFRGDLGNVNAQTIRDEQAMIAGDSALSARYSRLLVAPGDSAAAAGADTTAGGGTTGPAPTNVRAPGADTTRDGTTPQQAAAPLDSTSVTGGQ